MTRAELQQIATPRTDGVRRDIKARGERDHVGYAAMTNLARQLERELIVACREVAEMKRRERVRVEG